MTDCFARAVVDAERADEHEVVRDLRAIVPSDPRLVWRDEPGASPLLVVTWVGSDRWDKQIGKRVDLSRELWVSLAPELQERCRNFPASVRDPDLRLEQLLGLPPAAGKDRFLELWVEPTDLFRPCADAETDDRECVLTLDRVTTPIAPDHQRWYTELAAKSYGPQGYPWTRLGYTFDWGTHNKVGLSEFVIRKRARVEVAQVTANRDYCR